MKKHMKYSTSIYNVYLKYFSPDDIYVYSIDEVFIESSLITFCLFARAPPRNLNFNFRFLGGFYYENSSY